MVDPNRRTTQRRRNTHSSTNSDTRSTHSAIRTSHCINSSQGVKHEDSTDTESSDNDALDISPDDEQDNNHLSSGEVSFFRHPKGKHIRY